MPHHERLQLYARLLTLLKQKRHQRVQLTEQYNWKRCARIAQQEPTGAWNIWLILAGRGFGKTRTGAETIRLWVEEGRARRLCLLGHTLEDVRKVMVEGESGLLAISPPWNRPKFVSSHNYLEWPSGARAYLHSAVAFEKLRGPQFDGAWIDELAKFPKAAEVFDQLMMGLRLGQSPRCVITTTPKSTPFLKRLLTQPKVIVTRGHTFENKKNLSDSYVESMQMLYEGTPLGKQELEGQLCDLAPSGVLWTQDLLDQARLEPLDAPSSFARTIVALDPAVTHHHTSDETGIIVASLDEKGTAYIRADLSGKYDALCWAKKALEAYHFYKADALVAEVNNGGDLVETMLREMDPYVSYKGVRASKGKWLRAEPCAALYKKGRVKHVATFNTLEKQMCTFDPVVSGISPDRLDALVWALFELCLNQTAIQEKDPVVPHMWRL